MISKTQLFKEYLKFALAITLGYLGAELLFGIPPIQKIIQSVIFGLAFGALGVWQIIKKRPNYFEEKQYLNGKFWGWFFIWWFLNLAGVRLGQWGKNTSTVSVTYFWIWCVLTGSTVVGLVLFARLCHASMKLAGKRWGWVLGLLPIIPLGFWVTFFVVRAYTTRLGIWKRPKIEKAKTVPVVPVGSTDDGRKITELK